MSVKKMLYQRNGDDDLNSSDPAILCLILVLILLSCFFSSAETALTTVNKIKIMTLAEEGNRRACTLLKVIENPGKMLGAILIGNNIVNLFASSLTTTLALHYFNSIGVSICTGILTLIILIFGEISPKTLASTYSEKLSLAYANVIYALMTAMTPFIFVTNQLSYLFLKLFHIDPNKRTDVITENELRTYVNVSHEDGEIEQDEKQMIYNVFDLDDTQAKDIMVPRVDMVSIDIQSSFREILEIYRQEKFTRYPVYEGSNDNVIGVLNIKDLLLCGTSDFNLKNLIREPFFTYEFKNTAELLDEMRKDSINFTIVLDEYGATVGLITLEDLLEEIVGEIRDEYDNDEADLIREISQQEYIIEGSMKLDDINDALRLEEMDLKLESEDYDSIGGYMIEHLDHLPELHEEITTESGIRLVVDKMDKNRIDKVHMYLPQIETSSQ